MDNALKTLIWQQFGAAIDMFGNAIRACPEELWRARLWEDEERAEYGEFWLVSYHTLRWLDTYLSGTEDGFKLPERILHYERDADGVPKTPYTKADLEFYLDYGRKKCQSTIEALTDERAQEICRFPWGEVSFLELLLYNMRHVQEHAAQLSLILGQKGVPAPDWVTIAGR
jgi:hypothetical protein